MQFQVDVLLQRRSNYPQRDFFIRFHGGFLLWTGNRLRNVI
jgi:hypothetical protein